MITLRHEASGREWRQRLNSSARITPGPHETWLSPLHRGQTFFHLTDFAESAPGSQWLVPRSYVASARVEITPEILTGRSLAAFDFADVALGDWVMRQ
jgi:hypothetical protein